MLKVTGISKGGGLHCICKCDCGNVIECTATDLEWRRSCGCAGEIEKEKHTKVSIALYGKKLDQIIHLVLLVFARPTENGGRQLHFKRKCTGWALMIALKTRQTREKKQKGIYTGIFWSGTRKRTKMQKRKRMESGND